MSSDPPLRISRQDGIVQLTMNRPHRRNALNPGLDEKLRSAFEDITRDASVRVVVLTGAGSAFSAGADLRAIETPSPDDVHALLADRLIPLVSAIIECPRPVIAAINGPAAGAGCALALACDLRLMADAASLSINFSEIGFVPDMGLSWFLTRQIGYARAFELAALGKTISADECLRLGLINEIADPEKLENTVMMRAQELAKRPVNTTTLTKQSLQFAANNPLRKTMNHEASCQRVAAGTDEHREGLQAFLEKRAPNFADL